MALRREAIIGLGGFDEALGPGARFPSGDDWDIAMRAILRGWHVYETAELAVVHHGFRSFADGRRHSRRDWVAIGAVCAKVFYARRPTAVVLPLWEFGAHALWPPFADLLRLHRPRGLGRIAGFLEGFSDGLRAQLDRATLCYAPPALAAPPP